MNIEYPMSNDEQRFRTEMKACFQKGVEAKKTQNAKRFKGFYFSNDPT
jgi:hypothetical protein